MTFEFHKYHHLKKKIPNSLKIPETIFYFAKKKTPIVYFSSFFDKQCCFLLLKCVH